MRVFSVITRVLTLPALLTGATVLLLYVPAGAISASECLWSELFLFLIPLLAYPVREIFHIGNDRRKAQRSLAMIFGVLGYTGGLIWALCWGANRVTKIIFGAYVLSTVVLLICNKLLHFKASGHACSSTAPLIFLTWQLWPGALLPCLAVVGCVYASSLRLGEHTLPQLLAGSSISALCGLLCMLIL